MVVCTTSPEELILKADLSAEYDKERFTAEADDWIYEARISNDKASVHWTLVKKPI